jgi:hypothetical protein
MNLQDKVFETTADFRARAASLSQALLVEARNRAALTAGRVKRLKTSLAALQVAGREFGKVAQRHASLFVAQNSVLARNAGKDVSSLARSAYQRLATHDVPAARKPRKAPTRKRKAAKMS